MRERSREGLQRELEVGGGGGRRRGFRKVSLLSVAGVLGGIPEWPAPECPAGLEREQVGGEKSYPPPHLKVRRAQYPACRTFNAGPTLSGLTG